MYNFITKTQALFSTYVFPYIPRYTPVSLAKNPYVETLRGMAIILVVLGHVIGSDSTGGMKVSDDSFLRYLYFTLEYVRMPLFTVISGWVYANNPIVLSRRENFIKGKFKRLMIPMVVVGSLLFLMRMVIPGTNSKPLIGDIWFNLVFPYDLFWFLYSLFLIFLVISVLDTQRFFRTFPGWLATLAFALTLLAISKAFLTGVPNFFSFKGAIYLFPFFVMGIGIYRFAGNLMNPRFMLVVLTIFCIGFILQQLSWFGYFPIQAKQSVVGIAVGVTAALLLFRMRVKHPYLIWIGSYAYTIFLFHVFFTGGTRIILMKAGFENQLVILILATFLAIMIPIAMDKLIRKSHVLSLLLLGTGKKGKGGQSDG